MTAGADRLLRAHLSRVVEPGDTRVDDLVRAHGHHGVVARLDRGDAPEPWVLRHRGCSVPVADVVATAARVGIRVVVPGDAEWPEPLDALEQAGLGGVQCLWVRGRLPSGGPAPPAAAVVGSRDASAYGAGVAADMAAGLVEAGWIVVSGAAFGVDAAAHRGALAAAAATDGPPATLAVLGCGVDRAYPAAHRDLLRRIADGSGAVVSELPPGASPYPWRFPARNRVIAALAAATVVVEAGPRSGAAHTARVADQLSRGVGAVPGPVHSRHSVGCHDLIRTGVADLVTGPADLLALAAPLGSVPGPHAAAAPDGDQATARPVSITGARARVHRCLSASTPRQETAVAARAGVDTGQARAVLVDLELEDWARRSPEGWRRGPGPRTPTRS